MIPSIQRRLRYTYVVSYLTWLGSNGSAIDVGWSSGFFGRDTVHSGHGITEAMVFGRVIFAVSKSQSLRADVQRPCITRRSIIGQD